MKLAYTLLGAALLLDPTPALAGSSCGGGSSGGSSSGGSSSGGSSSGDSGGGYSSSYDSSSSDSSSSSTSSGCIDDTDVHGYRRCTKFGAWSSNMRLPRVFIELGSNVRNFNTGLASDQTGTIAHGTESFAYRVVMPTAGDDARHDTAMMSTLRLSAGVTRHVYAGVEGELGGLVAPARASAEMTTSGTFGAPVVEQGHGLVVGAAGIAGVRMGTGRATLALEGAGGVRSVRYRFTSTYHDCVSETIIESTTALVEARARAEMWLNPWLTAGATLGSNVLVRNDWMAGVYLGIHTRAFGGGR